MKMSLTRILAWMALASITAFAREIDVTADIRAKSAAGTCGAPTITLEQGNHHASYPEARLFDGKIDTNGRFLADKVPVSVIYEQPTDYDGYGVYSVTRYTLSQLTKGSSQNNTRCPKDWALYGWDGAGWRVIDTQSGVTWVNNAAEDKTFEIAPENKFATMKYKFVMTKNSGSADPWSIGIGELVIYGQQLAEYLQMGEISNVGGTLTVSIGVTGLPAPGKLIVCYGTADGGENAAHWPLQYTLATLPAGDTASAQYVIPGVGLFEAVRFAVVGEGADTTNPFSQFSALQSYEQSASRENGPFYVRFVDFDGLPLGAMQTVESGGAATAPAAPTVAGYVFDVWDTDFESVTSDLVVRPIYRKPYTVRFLDKAGQVFDTQTVLETHDAVEPISVPEFEGYVFYAWDKDFTAIAKDIDVTALYHELFTVQFVDADGSVIETQRIEDGKGATAPDMTGRTSDGYPFSTWDKEYSVVTGNMVVTAVYAPLPEAVAAVIASGKCTEGLIWRGGAGSWDSQYKNWYTLGGVKVLWTNGSRAIIPAGSELTVGSDIVVAEVNAFGDVVIKGNALTFVAPASVTYSENGTVRFENDVVGTVGLVAQARPRNDIVIPAVWHPSVFAEGEDIRGQKEETLFFANASLADITGIGATLYTKFGNNAALTYTIDTEHPMTNGGVFYYENDGSTLTAQFQGKSDGGYGGVYHCVKVQLTQDGTDVLGKIVYVRSATCTYTGNSKTQWGAGWKIGNNCDESPCVQDGYTTKFYDLKIGIPERIIYDVMPDDIALELAGDYLVDGGLELKDGVGVLIDGGFSVLPKITIADGCSLAFGRNADVQLHNKGTGDNTNIIGGGPVEIFGTVTVDKGPSTSYGPYNLFGKCTAVNVRDGGELVLSVAPYSSYGYATAKFNCYGGGNIRLAAENAIGCNGNKITLYSGMLTNECAATKTMIVNDCTLWDGAVVAGSSYNLGVYNAYVKTTGKVTQISAKGTSPSVFAAETIKIGSKDSKPSSASNNEIAEFIVDDVTGDDSSDLIVTSDLVKNGTPKLTVADGRDNDYRTFHGLVKKGAGTLELNGTFDLVGTVKLNAGTVRLGSTAGGTMGALVMTGDASLDFAEGASIAFDDSSAFAWTEGTTLNLVGDIRRKTVRVGTASDALTEAQLAAIRVNGAECHAMLDSNGYLCFRRGLILTVR